MNSHVPYNEFIKDSNRFLDEAQTAPVYLERSNGTTVLIPEADYERLKRMAGERRGSEGLLAALRAFGPLDEEFPRIDDPPPKPFDLDI